MVGFGVFQENPFYRVQLSMIAYSQELFCECFSNTTVSFTVKMLYPYIYIYMYLYNVLLRDAQKYTARPWLSFSYDMNPLTFMTRLESCAHYPVIGVKYDRWNNRFFLKVSNASYMRWLGCLKFLSVAYNNSSQYTDLRNCFLSLDG